MSKCFDVKSLIYLTCLTLIMSFLPLHNSGRVSAAENNKAPEFTTLEKPTVNSEKDEFSTVKDNGDGSFTKKIYSEPIYREDNSQFEAISSNLVEHKSTDEIQPKNTAIDVSFNSSMENGEYASFQNNSHQLIYKLIDAEGESETIQASDVTPSTEGNKIFHKDIFPNITLRSIVFDSSVKEDLILEKYKGYNTFKYEINTNLTPKEEENGSISFYDKDKKLVYYLPKPYMTDSNIDEHSGEPSISNEVEFKLAKEDNKWILTLVADSDWLKSSDRVYPVYIDPTTSLGTSEDAFVSDAYPTTNYGKFWESASGYYSLKVGKYDSTSGTNYSYIKPTISGLNSAIVDSATFNIYTAHSYSSTTATGVWLDEVKGDWSENNLTWNNKPSSTNITSDSVYKGQWAQFNVTDSVNKWVKGESNNYGFKLHTNGNGQSFWKKFYASENSTNKPYLTVNYHYPTVNTPTAEAFTNANSNNDGYVNLNWDNVSGAKGYKVWIYNGKNYESFDVGNTTTWSTKGKGIWPTSSEVAAGQYTLHKDGNGAELAQDPSQVYKNSGGKYGSNTNYWFRVTAIFDGGESNISTEASPTIPNLKYPSDMSGKVYASGNNSGYANLYWGTVSGATGYKIWVFNGKNYESFDVGNATTWSTKGKGIWPTSSEIAAGKYTLHKDGNGAELAQDPSQVYKNSGGKYGSNTNYWFRISAYNSKGETVSSDYSYQPKIPNLSIPATPSGSTTKNDDGNGFVNLNWNSVSGATGYKVAVYNGKNYESFDVGNATTWSTKGKGIWPTSSEVAAGQYTLHKDGSGAELAQDPSQVYKNSGGTYPNALNYWFRIIAYNTSGETIWSGAFMPNFDLQTSSEEDTGTEVESDNATSEDLVEVEDDGEEEEGLYDEPVYLGTEAVEVPEDSTSTMKAFSAMAVEGQTDNNEENQSILGEEEGQPDEVYYGDDGYQVEFPPGQDPREQQTGSQTLAKSSKPDYHLCFVCGPPYEVYDTYDLGITKKAYWKSNPYRIITVAQGSSREKTSSTTISASFEGSWSTAMKKPLKGDWKLNASYSKTFEVKTTYNGPSSKYSRRDFFYKKARDRHKIKIVKRSYSGGKLQSTKVYYKTAGKPFRINYSVNVK